MKRLHWLLAVIVMCALPSRTLASPHLLSVRAQTRVPCGIHVSSDEVPSSRRLKCITGTALNVSRNAMQVRPAHGARRRVRFTDETLFETDSGRGVLDGLVSGDRVCVVYTPRAGTIPAVIVAFDPTSIPCRPGKHLRPVNGGPGDG